MGDVKGGELNGSGATLCVSVDHQGVRPFSHTVDNKSTKTYYFLNSFLSPPVDVIESPRLRQIPYILHQSDSQRSGKLFAFIRVHPNLSIFQTVDLTSFLEGKNLKKFFENFPATIFSHITGLFFSLHIQFFLLKKFHTKWWLTEQLTDMSNLL